MLFRKLRKEDLLLDGEDLDNMSDQELTKICFQRGININTTRKEQLASLKLWLSISLKANVPHTLLQLIRIHDFNQELFEVEEDETQDEILRRSKSDAYYIESVRVFEKAFGIDRLERIIQDIQAKRNAMSQTDDGKPKYIFSEEDLRAEKEALVEFQMRHTTITERINETYKVGKKMVDFLEKQIILDYHFRGE